MKSIKEVINQYKEYINSSINFDVIESKFGFVICCYDSVAKDLLDPTGLIKSGEQLESFIKDDMEYYKVSVN